jgi:hypothetical protein
MGGGDESLAPEDGGSLCLSLFENGKIDNIDRREGHALFVSIGGRIRE